jgi:hypothetical protein
MLLHSNLILSPFRIEIREEAPRDKERMGLAIRLGRNMEHGTAQGTGHRAQGTGHRAQGTGLEGTQHNTAYHVVQLTGHSLLFTTQTPRPRSQAVSCEL